MFLNFLGYQSKDKRFTDRLLLTAFDVLKDPSTKNSQQASSDEGMVLSNSNSFLNGDSKMETPNVKKRHRRMKSSGLKNSEYDGIYFLLNFFNKIKNWNIIFFIKKYIFPNKFLFFLNFLQMLMVTNFTLCPWTTNNGTLKPPTLKREMNGFQR